MSTIHSEQGSANPLLVASVILGGLAAVFAGGLIWIYGSYLDARDNVDKKVAVAVTQAKKEQSAEEAKKYEELRKQPYDQLQGPSDLGAVTLNYPNTWSVYVAKSGKEGQYEAYLHPGTVPAVVQSQAYATRVLVTRQGYEAAVSTYRDAVNKGTLRSTSVTVNGFTGVRFDGSFNEHRKGSVVLFKVRDKTLTLATDSEAFLGDFNDVVLKSIDFNP